MAGGNKIYLLRHASAAPANNLPDLERPLSDQGLSEANEVAGFLKREGCSIDLVLSSHALRARETAALILRRTPNIRVYREAAEIYEASVDALLKLIAAVEEDLASLLIVGHNPGVEELLSHLTGKREGFRPATLAIISVSGRWSEVSEGGLSLEWLVHPHANQFFV
jgi:phosphohistidine phosphatase